MTKNIDFFKTTEPSSQFSALLSPPPKSQAKSTKIAINFKKYFASWSKLKLHSDVIAISTRKLLRALPVLGLGARLSPAVTISSGFGTRGATG